MSVCSRKIEGDVQYELLAKEIGDSKATAIYKMYNGFQRGVEGYTAENFFKDLPNGEPSTLYKELKDRGLNPTTYFAIALSDEFIQKYGNWIEGKEVLKVDKNNNIIGKTISYIEPKAIDLINYNDSLDSIIDNNISLNINKSEIVEDVNKFLAQSFVDSYGINLNIVQDTEAKDGSKAWYSSKDNSINLVESRMSLDSAIHEMAHPIITMFRRENQTVYASLLRDLDKYKEETWYKQVKKKYEGLSALKMREELLVTAIGLNASDKLKNKLDGENKSILNKLTDWFIDLIMDITKRVSLKYGANIDKEGNIDLSNIDEMTINDFSDILLSDYAIKGVREGILRNNNFYDKNGKRIDISNYKQLSNYISNFSKDLENDKNSSNTKRKKLTIEELYSKSEYYKSTHSNEQGGESDNGKKLYSATSYIKSKHPGGGKFEYSTSMAFKATVDYFGGDKEYDKQKRIDRENRDKGIKVGTIKPIFDKFLATAKTVEAKINENIKEKRSISYGLENSKENGNELTFLEYYMDSKAIASFSAKLGSRVHKIQENFFASYQNKIDAGEEFELDDFALNFIVNEIPDDETKPHIEGVINSLVEFINQIKKENKGRKIVFKPEFRLQNKELGMAAIADLVIFYDDAEFEVYDTKTKKRDFDNAWNNSFENYTGDGLVDISISGRNETSLQTSVAALLIEANTGLLFKSNRALYFKTDLEINRDSEGFYEKLKSIKLVKDRNNTFLSLNDYRSELLKSINKQDFFVDKSEYEKDSINDIPELMEYLLNGNNLDLIDAKKSANIKLKHLDINPKDNNDIGYFTGKLIDDITNPASIMNGEKIKEFISLKDKTDEQRLDILIKHYESINDSNLSTLNDIIEWNNTGIKPSSLGKRKIVGEISNIIKTIPQGYKVKRLSDVKGMEEFRNVPILIAEDPTTKDSTLIYVSNRNDSPLILNKKRTTILGVDYADKVASVKFKNKHLKGATKKNFRSLFLGLAAIKMKEVNPNFKVERLYVSKGANSGGIPHVLDMKTIMPVVRTVLDNAKITASAPMKRLKDNISIKDIKSYNVSYLNNFKNILATSNIVKQREANKIIDDLNKYQNFQVGLTDILDSLMSLEQEMRYVIKHEYNQNVEDNIEYISLAKTVREIFGITDSLINDKANMINSYLTLEHNSPQEMRQALRRITSLFDLAIRKEFNIYEKNKNKVLEPMFKSKGLSFNEKYLTQSMLKGYDNLFINQNNYENPSQLMTLKDPDDLNDKSLTDEEREFIRFFNDQIYQQMKTLYPRMYEDIESEDEARELTKGWVPVFKATIQTRQARMQSPKVNFELQEDRHINIDRTEEDKLSIDNNFLDMFNRRTALAGYDMSEDKPIEDFDFNQDVETNLEYILGRFVTKGIETKMHNYTLFAHNSMDVLLKGQAFMFGEQSIVNKMLAELEDSVSMYVRNETPERSTLGKFANKASYLTSMSIIAFSSKQAVMDTLTYTFASSANAMSNVLYKLFGGRTDTLGYFDVKSWSKAGALVMRGDKVVREIMREFALDTDDSLVLSGDSRLKSMRKGMMEMGFFVTKEMSIETTVQVFIAGMIYDGSFNAYSVNEETGLLEYDEKKDRRLYDDKGKVKDEAFLYALKKEMFKEGQGLEDYDENIGNDNLLDRKLKVGYTNKERTTIIYKSIDMIGAISKTTKIKAEQVLLFKHFLKFKTWIVAKKDLYFKEGMISDSFNEWERIINADGSVEYRLDPQYTEGILSTIGNIFFKMRAYGIKLENGGKLTDIERKNLAILTTHLSFAAAIALLSYGLALTCDDKKDFCWIKHTQTGKTVKGLLDNVAGDMFILGTIWNITSERNSLFAVVSVTKGIAERLYKLIFSIPFSENEDDSWLETFDEYMSKSWATYRSTKEFYEITTGFEGNIQDRKDRKQRGIEKAKENRKKNRSSVSLESQTAYSEAFTIGGPYDINYDDVDWSGDK